MSSSRNTVSFAGTARTTQVRCRRQGSGTGRCARRHQRPVQPALRRCHFRRPNQVFARRKPSPAQHIESKRRHGLQSIGIGLLRLDRQPASRHSDDPGDVNPGFTRAAEAGNASRNSFQGIVTVVRRPEGASDPASTRAPKGRLTSAFSAMNRRGLTESEGRSHSVQTTSSPCRLGPQKFVIRSWRNERTTELRSPGHPVRLLISTASGLELPAYLS